MFRKLPIVLTADTLIERAFKKSKKIQIVDRNTLYKKKKIIIRRTDSFSTYIIDSLENYVKKFPSINNLSLFYQELIDIKIDKNKLKKSLGAVDWARKTCQMIYGTQAKSLQKSKKIDFLMKKQQEIYGRISSVLKQIDKELTNLAEAQNIMMKMPDIYDIPTVVIAGYPNVGKSSLLRCLSKAKPKIAKYPFTTKEIHVGHIQRKEKFTIMRFQIIDTPGLLDRPFSDRNKIEQQAIAALKFLADIIIFIIDPSETCGYPLINQKKLLTQIKKMFKDSIFIIVENKADFKKTTSNYLKVSCETKQGIDQLIDELFNNYKEKNKI